MTCSKWDCAVVTRSSGSLFSFPFVGDRGRGRTESVEGLAGGRQRHSRELFGLAGKSHKSGAIFNNAMALTKTSEFTAPLPPDAEQHRGRAQLHHHFPHADEHPGPLHRR